jgi:glycosyltransferase involved in cell wall biosynthesis
MKSPLITVVLPVWKGADCIDETVKSILAQTFADWELLILGEPGSDEKVKQISQAYALELSRIQYIESETRLGLAATLNQGIELASGKYIARVDVDDPSYPNRFEKQTDYMERHPEIAILGTQQFNVYPTPISQITAFPLNSEDISAGMLFRCCNGHSSLFLRRELFIKNNWRYPLDKLQEDFALWLSLVGKAKFANLDEVLVERRVGFPENLTSIHGDKIALSSSRLLAEYYQKFFAIDISKYKTKKYISRHGHLYKSIDLDDFSVWLVECAGLFMDMEKSNKVFDAAALSRTLRKQWNWMLDRCFLFDFWARLYDFHIPHLPEEQDGKFEDAIRMALQEKLGNSGDTKTLLCVLRHLADSFVCFVKHNVFREKFRAVVFGAGFFCNNFFDKRPDSGCIFDLIAFCDNDKN